MFEGKTVLVKGAGDFASGTIRRLHIVGMNVVATELADPLCVRREVSFSTAVERGEITVEGVTGRLCGIDGVKDVWAKREVAVVVDPDSEILNAMDFDAVVDGRMAKRNIDTALDQAPAVVALGPGFTAGVDCHAVVETLMGHDMGRVVWEGSAHPDTGKAGPGEYGKGWDWDRIVFRAPKDGVFRTDLKLGDIVEEGAQLGDVDGEPVVARVGGVLRGLIRDGHQVEEGLKLGDVDPSGEKRRAFEVMDKANAVAGGVMEALAVVFRRRSDNSKVEELPGG